MLPSLQRLGLVLPHGLFLSLYGGLALVDDDYSSPQDVETNITGTLTGGTPAIICVIGSDGVDWQPYSEATGYEWCPTSGSCFAQ